jgi:hypothetical protein
MNEQGEVLSSDQTLVLPALPGALVFN